MSSFPASQSCLSVSSSSSSSISTVFVELSAVLSWNERSAGTLYSAQRVLLSRLTAPLLF